MKTAYNVDIKKLTIDPTYAQMYEPLSPAERNDLAESILAAGIMIPIIAEDNGDGTYTILSGHNRFEIVRQNGWKEIPIIQIAETPEEKATALMDNALRRQMTEKTRRAALARRNKLREEFLTAALHPDLAKMYQEGKLPERLAQAISFFGPERQKNMLEDGKFMHTIAQENPDLSEERDAELEKMTGKLDEALLKVERAEEEKKGLEAAIEKKNELLKGKQLEVDGLKRQLTEIGSDIAKEVVSLRNAKEDAVREEVESRIRQSTAQSQRLSKGLEQANRETEAVREEKRKVETSLENVGKEYKAYAAILEDLKERYSTFIDHHRKPEVWVTRLESMKLEAQAIQKTLNVAPWPKEVVITMEGHAEAAILALKSAIESARKNSVDFTNEFDNQAAHATEQAKTLMGRKAGRNGKKKGKEIEDWEGEDEVVAEAELE